MKQPDQKPISPRSKFYGVELRKRLRIIIDTFPKGQDVKSLGNKSKHRNNENF